MAAVSAMLSCAVLPASAQQLRSLGIDVSTYQGSLLNWATLKSTNTRDFVLIRYSRGGTTGEDHRQGGYNSPTNTFYNLSQRYDDPYFVTNITTATAA